MSPLRPTRLPLKSGFTLVELLVVIAIISLLAAIMFPVFGRARENARRSSCLSNMKQLGLGVAQYTQDYDERLPMSLGAAPDNYSWSKRIYPYVKSDGVYNCPDIKVKASPSQTSNGYYVSYGYNDNLTIANGSGRSIAEMVNAAGTSLLAEANRFTNAVFTSPVLGDFSQWPDNIDTSRSIANGGGNVDYQWKPPGCWDRSYHEATTGSSCSAGNPYYSTVSVGGLFRPVPRHFNGLTVAYADGHAKWITMAQFLGPMPEGWPYGDPNNSWDNK